MGLAGLPKTGYSAPMPQLILASQSPARKSLLESLGVEFTIQPADIDESVLKNETPLAYIKRIAVAKAQAVAKAHPGSIVIAADTPCTLGRRILQTPQTQEEAIEMLRLQSGRRIAVHTVVAVVDASGKLHSKTSSSWIKLKRLTQTDIDAYIEANLWQKSAGGIKSELIQSWIITTHGSVSGILGLPLYETATLLARTGIKVNPFQ